MQAVVSGTLVAVNRDPSAALPVATKPAAGIVPRVDVNVRAGTLADVPFIDRLQKAHSRELGFLPTAAIEGKVRLGQVLIAEGASGWQLAASGSEQRHSTSPSAAGGQPFASSSELPAASCQPPASSVGYLIAADRYSHRDEVGYVTQINVLPEYRRHLVAAVLLQAQFDRSAYGCRLYCCWCAQDLKANEFWEAMGFTPIAFRTGSRTKGKTQDGKAAPRIHLFWQKRVRADDAGDVSRGGTAWWYPAKTEGGEMREDRLVFPIPPGVHWRDVLPVVLPEQAHGATGGAAVALPSPVKPVRKKAAPKRTPTPPVRPPGVHPGGAWFAEGTFDPVPTPEEIAAERAAEQAARAEARAAAKAARAKVDPRLIAMARELRDRWAEQADTIPALPGKHDVRRGPSIGLTTGPRAAALPTTTPALPEAA